MPERDGTCVGSWGALDNIDSSEEGWAKPVAAPPIGGEASCDERF